MKTLVQNYTFSASAKQVTLTDYASVNLESLLLITNVTDNIIIYNFADQTKGATISGNIITLEYDTTGMSDSDDLQIFIEDGIVAAKDASVQDLITAINSLINKIEENNIGAESNNSILRKMLNMVQSLAIIDTANRQRVAIDIINGNLPGNQNINANTIAGFSYVEQLISETRRTFANGTRANLTIT